MMYQASGVAISIENITSLTKFFDSRAMILLTDAPSTFTDANFFSTLLRHKGRQTKQTQTGNQDSEAGKADEEPAGSPDIGIHAAYLSSRKVYRIG